MRVALTILVCALLLATSAGIGGAMTTDAEVDRPTLVYDISLQSNGDAHWEIQAMFPIGSESEEEAFEELADLFEADDGEEFIPVDPYVIAAQALSEDLDRSMRIDNVDRTVIREEEIGILSVSFRWTAFAIAGDERVDVGDVFETENVRWFTRLEANERLLIRAPTDYMVESSGLPTVDRTMVANGPMDLESRDLHGAFVAPGDSVSGWVIPLIGGLLGIVGIAAIVLFTGALDSWRGLTGSREETLDPEEDALRGENEESLQAGEPTTDSELLSDEERVLSLIERNGGRMKQADIVTETDWSNAKVSQLLSQMADNGIVEKLRIGRENLIRLPEEPEP